MSMPVPWMSWGKDVRAVGTRHDEALYAALAQERLDALAIGVEFVVETDVIEGRPTTDHERAGRDPLVAQPLRDLAREFGRIGIERATGKEGSVVCLASQVGVALDVDDVGDVTVVAGAQRREYVVLEIGPELAVQGPELGLLLEQQRPEGLVGAGGTQVDRAVDRAAVAQGAGEGRVIPGLLAVENGLAQLAEVGLAIREVTAVGPGAQATANAAVGVVLHVFQGVMHARSSLASWYAPDYTPPAPRVRPPVHGKGRPPPPRGERGSFAPACPCRRWLRMTPTGHPSWQGWGRRSRRPRPDHRREPHRQRCRWT